MGRRFLRETFKAMPEMGASPAIPGRATLARSPARLHEGAHRPFASSIEGTMTAHLRAGCVVAAALGLGSHPAMAQSPGAGYAPRTYACGADAHCNVYCTVDGERQFQTGTPQQVTVTPLAPNNYLVELTEQNGRTEFAYLAGTKVVCMLEGVSQKGSQ
jgi:hypothetical protein